MKIQLQKFLLVGKNKIQSTEGLAKLVFQKGRKNICEFLPYMKAIKIDTDLDTDTGLIKWATEDGTLISENGYHYNIDCFI